MPRATFKNVYAVSSEDPSHPASNLLKMESGKKWKTKDSGEKSAFVILQLEKSEKVKGIDIGNEHSAFVEVLVAKNGCNEFKEILVTYSLMTPIESKNSTNINRVRCFGIDLLADSIAQEKWDLVKIICTQPFNKHVKYGLSFVVIHTEAPENPEKQKMLLIPEEIRVQQKSTETSNMNDSTVIGSQKNRLFGNFKLREDSPDSESENSSSLFQRWKKIKDSDAKPVTTAAAAIRAASRPSFLKTQNEDAFKPSRIIQKPKHDEKRSENVKVVDRNRSDVGFSNEDKVSNPKLEAKILKDRERLKEENEQHSSKKSKKITDDENSNTTKDSRKEETKIPKIDRNLESKDSHKINETKRNNSSPVSSQTSPKRLRLAEKEIVYKPFNKLLEGVFIVISGIQNPERASLREKAIQMGAKYKPDWDNTCTHLISAFKNTPKYNQVKGIGKIVKKSWIDECFKRKKRIPWRRFALDSDEERKPESEDEILDSSMKPSERATTSDTSPTIKPKENISLKRPETSLEESDIINYYNQSDLGKNDSGSDTEEEIERIERIKTEASTKKPQDQMPIGDSKANHKARKFSSTNEMDLYNVSTDEEECTKKQKSEHETDSDESNFLKDKTFFVSGKLKSMEQIKLKNLIEKFQGKIITSIREANYAITKETIDAPSDFTGEFLHPNWVYDCNDMESLVPMDTYKIR